MQEAVLSLYSDTHVEYVFTNRNPTNKFNQKAFDALCNDVANMRFLAATYDEFMNFKALCPWHSPQYIEYLRNYQYDPSEVQCSMDKDGNLTIKINGLWHRTILWEVPLLALISKNYFKYIDTNWNNNGQEESLHCKGKILSEGGCKFADFGTRRRRNFESHNRAVQILSQYPGILGTSNVHLAIKYGVKAIGTMAHSWIMAHQVLTSITHSNRSALEAWNKVYRGSLGIALTDTLGTDLFFKDFDGVLSRLYDGIRHDSGSIDSFVNKAIAHYKSKNINPLTKTIVFSDALNVEKAIKIAKYCEGKIGCSFGIGTNFSNDYPNSPALNIVIKLNRVNGIPVVKLSDSPGKAMGDRDALRVTRWLVNRTPLD